MSLLAKDSEDSNKIGCSYTCTRICTRICTRMHARNCLSYRSHRCNRRNWICISSLILLVPVALVLGQFLALGEMALIYHEGLHDIVHNEMNRWTNQSRIQWPQQPAVLPDVRGESEEVLAFPLRMHQTWKDTNCSTYPHQTFCTDWKELFSLSGGTYTLWTDSEIRILVEQETPHLLEIFDSFPQAVERADFARYLVLWVFGGVYADIDVAPGTRFQSIILQRIANKEDGNAEFLTLLTSLLSDGELTFCEGSDQRTISNHFLMAKPWSPFLGFVLNHTGDVGSQGIPTFLPYLRVMRETGPLFFTHALQSYQSYYQDDQDFSSFRYSVIPVSERESYAFHYSGRSWHKIDGVIFNHLAENFLFDLGCFLSVLCLVFLCMKLG